ncbi:aminotransferase class I/II-fold pyridoxal phosphate-dependent enzyme [Actinoplanes sp. L3-i22]|uniref:aminotransferase class I/II-fold pyridoxal phosphate-dependent enzyme n=1 Tax=Actinoplanes sp. L3-i22 TaxID=2836373 RepID=UPI001C851DB1|nr:aminotransferase class I/II-fold pyridoxal phosphate-dependent enzyme [Actinoplanes sp. L3-i22]
MIEGNSAAEIVRSVRGLVHAGQLPAGVALPAIRDLAGRLGVNRNTVAAAYAQLATAGVVETRRRGGTVVLGLPEVDGEGRAAGGDLVNLAGGNPDPALLPSLADAIAGYEPVLYGAPAVDDRLHRLAGDLPDPHRLVLANGAADGMERLLTTHLTRGDQVAVEDPCYLAAIGTLRVNGLRAVPVPTDADGMSASGLAAALAGGARAVIITPRAHNPTGASLTAGRAGELRAVLTAYPEILVVEDDHFSMISARDYHRVTPPGHPRWALVRSVSKFLGPDLRTAFVLADPVTAARLESGATWVSHLLQHVVASAWDESRFARARAAYATRSGTLVDELGHVGIALPRPDGLNVWIPVPGDGFVAALAARGWAVRDGRDFAARQPAIRVTTSTITPVQATAFAADLAALR